MSAETKGPRPVSPRLWEVDFLRGVAVVLMIFYHLVFDLYYFDVYSVRIYSGPWQFFARSIGSTFIFLLGVSLTLRYAALKPRLSHRQLFAKYLLRGAKLVGWGMVITAVTYFIVGRGFVVFGILHLLGLATILAYPFLRSRWASLGAGIAVILVGRQLPEAVSHPWFIWLGVGEFGRYMVDWYPVFPWFGIALLGIFVGFTLYPEGRRGFVLPGDPQAAPVGGLSLLVRGLSFLGRHSLVIYLVHQPIMLALLYLMGIASL